LVAAAISGVGTVIAFAIVVGSISSSFIRNNTTGIDTRR
jgi:hypothetical protein